MSYAMKKHIKLFLFFHLLFITQLGHSQIGAFSCAELQTNPHLYQSCATNVPFQNSVGGNTERYSTTCIGGNFRGPTWFFMKIQHSGDIRLQISQVNNAGAGTDVDFVLWGPFPDMNNICGQLNTSTEVDCSWLPDSIEEVYIPNGIAGEIYILLVDNYSNQAGQISISQIGGSGSSDCSFLSSVKLTDFSGNDVESLAICKPNTAQLRAFIDITDFPGTPSDLRFNYKWYRNNTLIATITDAISNTDDLTNITESGTYKVEITAYDSTDPTVDLSNLIVSTDEAVINFHTLPQPVITTTNDCLDTQPLLTASINNTVDLNNQIDILTYQWFRNNSAIVGATNTNLTPTTPGDYWVTVQNGPCGLAQSNTIVIKQKPVVVISNGTAICENDAYTLTSQITNATDVTNISFQWFKNSTIINGATSNTLTISGANQPKNTTASYHLEVTEQNTCTGVSNTVTITVNEAPSVQTTPILLEQCDYILPNNDGIASVNLTQMYGQITNNVNGLKLLYYEDAALTQLILTPENYTNTVPFNQTIYVKAIDENRTPSCTSVNTATISLQVHPTSIAAYPNIAAVCPEINNNYGFINFDQQRNLIKNTYFATTAVTISFYATAVDASVLTNALTNTSQIPIGAHTIYTRVALNGSCVAIGTFTVEVHDAPLQNNINTVLLCENENFVLNLLDAEASNSQSAPVNISYYRSFNDAATGTATINKNTPGNYPVGVTTLYAAITNTRTLCFSIVAFDIKVFQNPIITAPSPMTSCGEGTAYFNLNNRIRQITGGNPNYEVFYYENQNDWNTNTFITNLTQYESGNKTLLVKVVDPTNHYCISNTTLRLQINPLPGNTSAPSPIEMCNDSGFDYFDLTTRASEIMGNTTPSTANLKYYLNENDAIRHNSNSITTPNHFRNTIADFQKIYVRVTSTQHFDSESGLPCYRILELDLYVRPFPKNNLLDIYYICVDGSNNILRPADIFTHLNSADYTFQWFLGANAVPGNEITGQTRDSFSTSNENHYSVRVTNITNVALCSSVFNFETRFTQTPASISANPIEIISFESNTTISAIVIPPSADYEYSIQPDYWQESPVFNNMAGGHYVLSVRNKNGCGETNTTFTIMDYPKFFTPNNDGHNDTWNIRGSSVVDAMKIYIYDRYGKLLKEIAPNGDGWNGTYQGRKMPSDDYWFTLQYKKDGAVKEFKSHFTLKR